VGSLGVPALEDADESTFCSAQGSEFDMDEFDEIEFDEEGLGFMSPSGAPGPSPLGEYDDNSDRDNGSARKQQKSRSGDQIATEEEILSHLNKNTTAVLHNKTFKPLPMGESDQSWSIDVNTDLFEGTMLQVFRQKDNAKNGMYHDGLFKGKNRVYVCQLQGRFKRKPNGPICLMCQFLDDNFSIGTFSKRFAKIWLGFARQWEKQLDICLDPKEGRPISLIMPVSDNWMAIVHTKKGDTPPQLGVRLPSFKDCVKMNKENGVSVGHIEDPDMDAIYTLEFYSQNLDMLGWKVFNIPVLPEFSLNRFTSGWPAVSVPCQGFAVHMREMGDKDTKFDRDGGAVSCGSFLNIRRGNQ